MDENRIVELLTRKIAGEASADELGELSYLLKKYPDSVYYEALLEHVWELGKQEQDATLSPKFHNHKLKFKDDLRFSNFTFGITGYLSRPSIFAILFVCIFFGAAAYILDKYDQRVPKPLIQIVADRGVRKEIKLPDGTLVRLNSDSKISYDQDMLQKDSREVNLIGEALFTVMDNSHPFIVKTNRIAVNVLGTEFNIKEYLDENRSETTLLKGSLELTINDRPEQKLLLKPSEKFTLVGRSQNRLKAENNPVLTIEPILPVKLGSIDYVREISWADNKLIFKNESFEELIPKLERWYNVRIQTSNSKIRSFQFTGVFEEENIVDLLERMSLIIPFKYELRARDVRIF